MSITSSAIAEGPGWRLDDVHCCAGPGDRPFEEQHASPCIALVTGGSFIYRNAYGRALLAPGACLLGDEGQTFECSHEHQTGDRCLSFHYAPDFLESVLAGVAGARRLAFGAHRLAPMSTTLRHFSGLEVAARVGDPALLTECAVEVAGSVYSTLADAGQAPRPPRSRDIQRVLAALRRIETDIDEDPDLATLAAEAAMSPYHFLRVFSRVVGTTPRQYQLQRRLGRVALALRMTERPISHLASDEGFGDLSSFERMFRRAFGASPRAWWRAGQPLAR